MTLLDSNIDPTGMVYGLIGSTVDTAQLLSDYLGLEPCVFVPDEGDELPLNTDSLIAFIASKPMTGMARVGNGFLYVLEDGVHVLGLDGAVVDDACLRHLHADARIEYLTVWGDQPPSDTRAAFIEIARRSEQGS